MSTNIGIIGLPKSGKTTIFNALTKGKADTGGYIHQAPTAHVGVAKVPEPRLKALAEILQPKRLVPAEVKYIDVGASVKTLVKDEGIGGELLNQLSTADILLNIIRAFKDERIPHVEGSVDAERDITAMNLELAFSDLAIIERRLDRIEISLKGAKPPERQTLFHEREMLMKLKEKLEQDIPLRELELSAEETKAVLNYQFLSAKPLLTVVNIGEEMLDEAGSLEAKLNSDFARKNHRVISLCGKLEMELAQLDDSAAQELRAGYGMKESGPDRIIKASYELLGLITFFTIRSEEVRAWSIPKDTTALKAAGKIHSDMEKGFIRVEVISYDRLAECGGLSEARHKGLLRLEGKDYIVQDGNILTILFNV